MTAYPVCPFVYN